MRALTACFGHCPVHPPYCSCSPRRHLSEAARAPGVGHAHKMASCWAGAATAALLVPTPAPSGHQGPSGFLPGHGGPARRFPASSAFSAELREAPRARRPAAGLAVAAAASGDAGALRVSTGGAAAAATNNTRPRPRSPPPGRKRLPANCQGELYVDASCIDCDTCRYAVSSRLICNCRGRPAE